MAKKQFYLVKRKDKLTFGKATFYCRFRDSEGNLLAWRSTGQTAKTAAENWALTELGKLEAGRRRGPITLGTFAADFFIPGRCSYLSRQAAKGRPVSDAWARAKRRMLVNHVFPALGKTRLDRLTRPVIERFLVDLKLSNQTRNHMLYALKTVLSEAEAESLIPRNPLEHAEPLGKKARRRDVFALDELRALFPPDRDELLRVWGQTKYVALFVVLATTGIREGEARALVWRNVLPEGWLSVERAVKEGGEIGTPKSGEARISALPVKAREVLEWWHEETPFPEADCLVFFGGQGRPLNRRTFSDILQRALREARIETGNRFLTTHSFRHTYNTMMRRSIPADTLRALVGHRDERMTSHYDHPTLADLVRALTPAREAIEATLKW